MREILFKAKRIDNGEWVEGYYYKISETTYCFKEDYERNPVPEHHYILQERMTDWGLPNQIIQIEVDPETLCQFTGLCDKSGKKIWEGDIISYQRDNDDCPFPNKDTKKRFGKVFYQGFRSTFAIGMGRNGSRSINDDLWKYVQNGNRVEVIGNIFDNPELLQENHERENNDKER